MQRRVGGVHRPRVCASTRVHCEHTVRWSPAWKCSRASEACTDHECSVTTPRGATASTTHASFAGSAGGANANPSSSLSSEYPLIPPAARASRRMSNPCYDKSSPPPVLSPSSSPNANQELGPGRYCSPRHRMPFESRKEGCKSVECRGEQHLPALPRARCDLISHDGLVGGRLLAGPGAHLALVGARALAGHLDQGPGRYCSPRHRMGFHSRNEGLKCGG